MTAHTGTAAVSAAAAGTWSLGDRVVSQEMLDLCGAQGSAFVPFFARLAFTLPRGPHVLAIPGTGDPDHLAANVAAVAYQPD